MRTLGCLKKIETFYEELQVQSFIGIDLGQGHRVDRPLKFAEMAVIMNFL